MKRVASPGLMHDTGCLGLVHWDDPEGWYGEGGGRRVQDGEHMYTSGGFTLRDTHTLRDIHLQRETDTHSETETSTLRRRNTL